MKRILLAEDNAHLRELVQDYLSSNGFEVDAEADGITAWQAIQTRDYQLILLDVMMPGMDGFSLCREIRDRVDCPILFVTAKTAESDLMEGLGIGGDDYITKPFGIGELRARVGAHLRRENREKKNMIAIGDVQFSMKEKKLYFQGEELALTKSEYAICEYLALNRGQVFSKERILEHVFGFDGESNSSAITEHMKNIRAKFQQFDVNPIETVWGMGYRWK